MVPPSAATRARIIGCAAFMANHEGSHNMAARIRKPGLEGANEDKHQAIVARWLDLHNVTWFHCPNETKAKPQYMAKRKRLGVKSGIADVVIIDPPPNYPELVGAHLELKRADGGKETDNQAAWRKKFADRGWATGVCHGSSAMIQQLIKLGYGER